MKVRERKQKFRLLKFLSVLYGSCDQSGFLELRPMTSNYEINYDNRAWISLREKKRIIEEIWKLRKKRHVFFGVGTRTKFGKKNKKGSKKCVKELPALFCDLDFDDFSGGKEEAREFIEDFFVPESIRVFSGHGYHLYFLLDKPYDVQNEGPERIERLLAVVQDLLFGDKVGEVSRVLRLPFTSNIKDPSHPVLTNIELIQNNRYSLRDFEDQFWHILSKNPNSSVPEKSKAKHSTEKKNGKIDINTLKVSDKIKTLIKKGNQNPEYKYASRSEADMAVITGLISAGYKAEAIKQIFEENPEGIGEKYHEKGNSKTKYLSHSIESAREFLYSANRKTGGQNEK